MDFGCGGSGSGGDGAAPFTVSAAESEEKELTKVTLNEVAAFYFLCAAVCGH